MQQLKLNLEKKEVWNDCPICGNSLLCFGNKRLYCSTFPYWLDSHFKVSADDNYNIYNVWYDFTDFSVSYGIRAQDSYCYRTYIHSRVEKLSKIIVGFIPIDSVPNYIEKILQEKQSLIKENASLLI